MNSGGGRIRAVWPPPVILNEFQFVVFVSQVESRRRSSWSLYSTGSGISGRIISRQLAPI